MMDWAIPRITTLAGFVLIPLGPDDRTTTSGLQACHRRTDGNFRCCLNHRRLLPSYTALNLGNHPLRITKTLSDDPVSTKVLLKSAASIRIAAKTKTTRAIPPAFRIV